MATPWLTFLSFLALSQSAHLGEHVIQMIQIHVLGLRGAQAQGLVGQLNIDWVHFIWNAWVLIAAVLLLTHFRANRWLALVVFFAGWHMLEHTVIMATYVATGVAGTPGLLGSGGALFGGLPLARPDLHFWYNLLETVPLLLAWRVQLART